MKRPANTLACLDGDSSDSNDDLALGAPTLDIGQRLVSRSEWENHIHDRAYNPRLDQWRDLLQLTTAGSHEQE